MRRLPAVALLLALALVAPPGRLASQEPTEDAPQAENRWQSVRDKGLSLLKPIREKAESEIQDLLAELDAHYFPAIKEAGFGVGEIQITIGVPTALTLHLQRFDRISQAKQEQLLEKYRDDATALAILEALFAADRFKVEGFEADGVQVTLGFPPSTTVVLSPSPANG